MGDLPCEPHLVQDALTSIGVGGIDQLEGDIGVENEIMGTPDITHAAPADPCNHLISPREHLTWRKANVVDAAARLDSFVIFVKNEERFDFVPQGLVVATGLEDAGRPIGGRLVQHSKEHLLARGATKTFEETKPDRVSRTQY